MPILILWGMVEALWGYAQLFGILPSGSGRFAVTGSFFNPGPYCAFLGCMIPVAVYWVIRKRNRAEEIGGWVYIALAGALMPILMGRTGWLAAGISSLIVWFCTAVKDRYEVRWNYARFIGDLLICLIASVLLYFLKPASASGRVFIWMMGCKAMWDAKGEGIGWDEVPGAIGEAQECYFAAHPDSIFIPVAGSPDYAFNEFLQLGIAGGAAVLTLFIVIPLMFTLISFYSRNYGIFGCWIAFLITCLGSYPLQFASFRILIWVLAIITVIRATVYHPDGRRRYIHPRKKAEHYVGPTMVILFLAAIPVCLELVIKEERHDPRILFERGRMLRRLGKFEASNEVFLEGLKYSGDPMFLNLLGRNMEDMGLCREAERYYRRSINRLPSRLYPYYLLAKMYAGGECRDSVKFEEVYRKATSMQIKVASPATEDMLRELREIKNTDL